jgi:uncharacterized membrane protein
MGKPMAEPDGQNPESLPKSPSAPRQQLEIIPAALDGALRSAGVDLQNPDVTKAIEISLSLMVATGSLPVPPASILAEYNDTIPGLGDKIVSWTEEQRKHRQGLEKLRTDGAERRMDRGQIFAGVIAVWGLTMAAAVGIFGSLYVGIALAVVSIGGPTAAIWLAKGMNQKAPPTASPNPAQHKSF